MTFGYTNRQIAAKLVLTHSTVANHVAHILAKLGAANRTQVAALVSRARRGMGTISLRPEQDYPSFEKPHA